MNQPEHAPSAPLTCTQCGTKFPANVTPDLCPKCLLMAGMETAPAAGPHGTVVLPTTTPNGCRGWPQAGEVLGHYTIIRLLGAGGMGAVFEAEDLDSGRRVALKVLSQALDSPEARERFFREGRLAASINHPNSVYVFGTEEIGGTPVIAMELVAGGTLQDRVRAQGPLPVGEAVDDVLQLIAGLEAAQRVGILHRDVKPSNGFVAVDGTVKIGDFGLSLSTTVRVESALTAAGTFLGTPAFCSPEQLRGEELNVRSDLYALGATLFYLVTGRPPFEAGDMAQLLATVLNQPAPSPQTFKKDLPAGLALVILRCLKKPAEDRFKSYDELRRALAPYGAAAPTPATLGLRFVAGVLDHGITSLAIMSLQIATFGNLLHCINLNFLTTVVYAIGGPLLEVLYFTLPEGIWGASPGKAICRLRIIGPSKNPPGLLRAFMRAVLYCMVPAIPAWIAGHGNMGSMGSYLILMSSLIVVALLFCTVRRRNGFAAIHDQITRTRVVSRMGAESRPALAVSETAPPVGETHPMVGPYRVLESLEKTADSEWLLGYDLRLLRNVWIHTVPPGTPPVPATWRDVARIGRLRWITGRRAPAENWDIFECANGEPLLHLLRNRQPWSQVRFWLYDLAGELDAATKDQTLPAVLALNRVWITADGRAKLLDFPAPGTTFAAAIDEPGIPPVSIQPPIMAEPEPCQCFLGKVAAAALEGARFPAMNATTCPAAVPLPLHAREFLRQLPHFPNAEAITGALQPLLRRTAVVSRWRRTVIMAGVLAIPALTCISMVFGVRMMQSWRQDSPGFMELSMLLQTRSNTTFGGWKSHGPTDRQFAIFIANHYRAIIANDETWKSETARALIQGESRRFAEQCIANHLTPTKKELADAEAAVKPLAKAFAVSSHDQMGPWLLLMMLEVLAALPAMAAALLFRGGLVLLIAGVTFVRQDGMPASRLRLFWRALVAWSPIFLIFYLCAIVPSPRQAWLAVGLLGGLTILSLLQPERGIPDRLADTWPVPR